MVIADESHRGSSDDTGLSHAALTVPDDVPLPYDGAIKEWDGSAVDLMVADAWAGCSFWNNNFAYTDPSGYYNIREPWTDVLGNDAYLNYVKGKMSSAVCGAQSFPGGRVLSGWYKQRINRVQQGRKR